MLALQETSHLTVLDPGRHQFAHPCWFLRTKVKVFVFSEEKTQHINSQHVLQAFSDHLSADVRTATHYMT